MLKQVGVIAITVVILVLLFSFMCGFLGVGNISITAHQADHNFVALGGQMLRVVEKGSGPDVLLIHGTPGSIEDMQPLLDSLANDFHVVAYDRPGHGYSSAKNISRNVAHNTNIAIQLIEHFELDSSLIIGHSYGGIIAMNLAIIGSPRISKSLVLGSPLFNYECETIYKLFKIPFLNYSMSYLVSGWYSKSKISNELPDRFAQSNRKRIIDPDSLEFRSTLWSQPKVILSKSLESAHLEDDLTIMEEGYNKLNHEVRVILGEDDMPYYITDLESKLPIPNLSYDKYNNCGHFIQMEQLDKLLGEIRSAYD